MSLSRPRSPIAVPFGTVFDAAALAALASALIPGAGQWLQGRRRQAAPLLIVSAVALLATVGAIWVLNRRGPVYILEVAMRPGALATIFVVNGVFLAVRAWAAADAYQGGRAMATRASALAGVVVMAMVVLPHLFIGAEAAQAHQVVTTVFQQPVAARNKPTMATARWRPGERLTVLFLGAERNPTGATEVRGAMAVTVFPGDDRVAAVTLPANLTGIPVPEATDHSPGNGSLTDLYRFGTRHRRLYPGSADPGAAMVKDGVQSLLGIPVHHAVVFDSSNLDETDMVDTPQQASAAPRQAWSARFDLRGWCVASPRWSARLGISVTSDIPLDLVPDMVELLPTLSPRQVLTVPITAPDYGRVEQKSQVADPERVRAAMVSLVKLSPEEAASRLGLDDPARCATGRPLQAAADNR